MRVIFQDAKVDGVAIYNALKQVVDQNVWQRIFIELLDDLRFGFAILVVGNHKNRTVNLLQGLIGLLHPFHPEFGSVVDAGGIYQNHRSDAKNLNGFLHRIGGGASLIRHDSGILSRQLVDEGAFSAVGTTVDANMCAFHDSFY